jgi:molecular chaperone GrpE (heat shock protein)
MKKEEKKQDDELEAKLEEAQKTQDDKKYRELEQKIIQLEKEKKELEEIAKRSQYEYINLKMDFDRFQKQTHETKQDLHVDVLIAVIKKFLPFIEDLRKSLENITEEHSSDPLTK